MQSTEILKQLTYCKTKAQMFHFRTSDAKEVNMAIEKINQRLKIKSYKRVDQSNYLTLALAQTRFRSALNATSKN